MDESMGLDYTDISKTYDDYRSFPDELLQRVVKLGNIRARTKVVEFGCQLSQKLRQEIARKKGFEVTSVEVHMTGYCSKCRRERK